MTTARYFVLLGRGCTAVTGHLLSVPARPNNRGRRGGGARLSPASEERAPASCCAMPQGAFGALGVCLPSRQASSIDQNDPRDQDNKQEVPLLRQCGEVLSG